MARKMAKENPDYAARKNLVNLINNQLSLVRRREKFIWANATMSPEQKRRELDKAKNDKNKLYRRAYEQIQKFND
jgi:hypothetical protein